MGPKRLPSSCFIKNQFCDSSIYCFSFLWLSPLLAEGIVKVWPICKVRSLWMLFVFCKSPTLTLYRRAMEVKVSPRVTTCVVPTSTGSAFGGSGLPDEAEAGAGEGAAGAGGGGGGGGRGGGGGPARGRAACPGRGGGRDGPLRATGSTSRPA